MYLNEERFEVEKRFREYLWTEYSFLKKEGLLFADNEKAINKLREYLPKDGFLSMSGIPKRCILRYAKYGVDI